MTYRITNQRDLRKAFWQAHPTLDRTRVTDGTGKMYRTDTRVAWCDWLDFMSKDNAISQELAQWATLEG